MKVEETQATLVEHQNSFHEVAKQPNTLERNLILAAHRAEIGRLQKMLAKAGPSTLPLVR